MNYETLLQKCLLLRDRSRQGEMKQFQFLIESEKTHCDLWQGAGFKRFEVFLQAHDIVSDIRRYRKFRKAVDTLGQDKAFALAGVDYAIREYQKGLNSKPKLPRENVGELKTTIRELQLALERERAEHAKTKASNAKLRAENARLMRRLAKLDPRERTAS